MVPHCLTSFDVKIEGVSATACVMRTLPISYLMVGFSQDPEVEPALIAFYPWEGPGGDQWLKEHLHHWITGPLHPETEPARDKDVGT